MPRHHASYFVSRLTPIAAAMGALYLLSRLIEWSPL